MLRNPAFADSNDSPDDDDPSSGNPSAQPLFYTITTSDSSQRSGTRTEHLEHELDSQRSIHNSEISVSSEVQSRGAGCNLHTEHSQLQIPTQQASMHPMEVEAKQLVEPQTKVQPHYMHERIDVRPENQPEDVIVPAIDLTTRRKNGLWRPPGRQPTAKPLVMKPPPVDARFRSSKPDLLANMIESGEQCNVHDSTTPNPTPSPQPLPPFLINLMASTKFDDQTNPQLPENDEMKLEVDEDQGRDQDEPAGPSGSLSLRDAGIPAGIRRSMPVRFRSSAEAASRCHNMRRSVPRLRRRPKKSETASTSRDESRASTSSTPL
ncbi:hypothetical protein GGR52DRAFT_311808 [Hypoxylon sp. FL1284]|nr:hypothetical protein GGR52DRAFT_311808 [Hypoxylon sp. FL1284]